MKKVDLRKNKIKLNKIQSEIRSKSRISECFHYDHENCQGPIKLAHSIQRNGRLSLLEEEVDKNMKLYSFTEVEINENSKLLELKPIGKASASTFFGFCNLHDNILFSEIEEKQFVDNAEHCFLHSYRAFAHSHHRKTEQINVFESGSKLNELMPKKSSKFLEGTKAGFQDGEIVRARMNEILKNETFEEMESLIIQFLDFYPVASSSSLTPKYSPKKNTRLNYLIDSKIPYQYMFFNVIPDLNGTIVIFSCLPESEKSIQYIDEFNSLTDFKQKQILTSILIGEVENTFISPSIYNLLTKTEKQILIKELTETSIFSMKYQKKHFLSKLNFFQNKFIKSV